MVAVNVRGQTHLVSGGGGGADRDDAEGFVRVLKILMARRAPFVFAGGRDVVEVAARGAALGTAVVDINARHVTGGSVRERAAGGCFAIARIERAQLFVLALEALRRGAAVGGALRARLFEVHAPLSAQQRHRLEPGPACSWASD